MLSFQCGILDVFPDLYYQKKIHNDCMDMVVLAHSYQILSPRVDLQMIKKFIIQHVITLTLTRCITLGVGLHNTIFCFGL